MSGNETHGARIRTLILETGAKLWRDDPAKVTSRKIASILKMSHGGVLYHFGTVEDMRKAIAVHAIEKGDSRVIVHLIAARHPTIKHMSDADRLAHMQAAR